MEVYVSKVLFGLFERSIIEPLGWLIFMDFTLRQEKLFPILPLPAFVNVDELLIQPLCATVAEHHPLFVPHKERVISFLSIVLALLGGIAKMLRDAGD
ncbi:hypothetical protein Ddc_20222 [Ditylenchus destructor]|nr:hypothetical protein Ddc_20222 [Ditylenchus destructor]